MIAQKRNKDQETVSISKEVWNRYRFLTVYASIIATVELILLLK